MRKCKVNLNLSELSIVLLHTEAVETPMTSSTVLCAVEEAEELASTVAIITKETDNTSVMSSTTYTSEEDSDLDIEQATTYRLAQEVTILNGISVITYIQLQTVGCFCFYRLPSI